MFRTFSVFQTFRTRTLFRANTDEYEQISQTRLWTLCIAEGVHAESMVLLLLNEQIQPTLLFGKLVTPLALAWHMNVKPMPPLRLRYVSPADSAWRALDMVEICAGRLLKMASKDPALEKRKHQILPQVLKHCALQLLSGVSSESLRL